MKILILDKFFCQDHLELPRFLDKIIHSYYNIKLTKFIKRLRKESSQSVYIKIISYNSENITNPSNFEVQSFTDYRARINRSDYVNIKNKVVQETKTFIVNFLNNVNELNALKYKEINYASLLEIHLIQFLNRYLGEIELVKKIAQSEQYDRIIFYNLYPSFIKYFQKLTLVQKGFEFYQDPQWNKIQKVLYKLKLVRELIKLIAVLLRDKFLYGINKTDIKKSDKNIVFVCNTQNQIRSVKSVYTKLKGIKALNPMFFIEKAYLSIGKIGTLLSFLRYSKKNWIIWLKRILYKIRTLKTESLTKYFLEKKADLLFISFFNNYTQIVDFFKKVSPNLVSISAEHNMDNKLVVKYCNLIDIPTIYIPHAGIPLFEEVVTKRDFSYITVAGEYDIDFYLKRGTPRENLFLTGAPRYQKFYETKTTILESVNDMFNGRKQKLNPKKTILLTTSPYDPTSIEKIITSVVASLKELNLLDNLIIKIHPAEDGNLHKQILNKLNADVIIIKEYDFSNLIKSSCLLISAVSTTTLEAMIAGTPVILLDFINLGFKFIHINPFNQEKFVKVAKTENQLTALIDQLINNQQIQLEYSKQLKTHSELFSYYDEKEPPTDKIVDLILKIINK